jgi:hypothetical protein
MTNIKLLHVSARGCHPQVLFQIKGKQDQNINVLHRPQWNDLNITYLLTHVLNHSKQQIPS